MSAKRKSFSNDSRPSKKPRQEQHEHSKNRHNQHSKSTRPDKAAAPPLLFNARSDWHAVELPAVDLKPVRALPPQRTIDELSAYATSLLTTENKAYNDAHLAASSEHKFLSTIMASGTLEDKVSALTLLVQGSPLHTMRAFDNLLGLAKKKSRNQALMAVAALKDLLGQGVVLPGDRKLRAFGKQPSLIGALQGKAVIWSSGDALPNGLQKVHLLVWAYEDWLKKKFFEMLQILETWCNDEIEYSRSRAITYVWELLKDKPEQEENLLRLLVNKLGDTNRKIASRASYLLLQLEESHPAMKMVITNSIESDSLFRPGQSDHAKYYAIITLNQSVLGQKDEELANRLLEIYFSLFVQLLKPSTETHTPVKLNSNGKPQGGGGKAGKMAAKKQKAEENIQEAAVQLHDKMISQVLTGVNRAFPYADTSSPTFEKQLDTIFRVAHSANFNTSIQALLLLQQISSRKHLGAERFYRTLYESLLDPRLFTSSKQVMYLNLLYKSLKADLNPKRVQAFVKRLLQVTTMHEAPFACGVLYLVTELAGTFPSIQSMLSTPEISEEDEEEHFFDVPDDDAVPSGESRPPVEFKSPYDPRKRDPEHAGAERTCLWEISPLLSHFHPSVALFTEAVYGTKQMPPKPDPTQHTLMHFLDRFVYRNPSTKQIKTHGSSVMQPLVGSTAANLLVKPGEGVRSAPLNTERFWAKKVEDVAPEDVFFHKYFNTAGANKKRKAAGKEKMDHDDDAGSEDDGGEDEIWEAIAASKPDVEGPDDDDDLSIGDLESAYDKSDDEESEGGIDLGGGREDEDGDEDANAFAELDGLGDDDDGEGEMDDFPELESDDDAFLSDDDDVPMAAEEDEASEQEMSRSKKQRAEKKKLKALPTFAAMEDYAKLLDAEPDDM